MVLLNVYIYMYVYLYIWFNSQIFWEKRVEEESKSCQTWERKLENAARLNTKKKKNSCRLAESIADAERLRVGGRERLHLLEGFSPAEDGKGREREKLQSISPGTNHHTHCETLLASSDVVEGTGGGEAPRRRSRALSIVSGATRRTRALSNTSYLRVAFGRLASRERKRRDRNPSAIGLAMFKLETVMVAKST